MDRKLTRSATAPIPVEKWDPLYASMWDLAFEGICQTPSGSFGSGRIIDMRHGLVVLWSTQLLLRFSELRCLRTDDLIGETIRIHRSKGGKSGTQSVDPRLVELTHRWRTLSLGPELAIACPILLPSSRGSMLDNNCFNSVARDLGLRFGLRLSSHCFRDTGAQLAYRQTQSIAVVKTMMGHRSLSTTEHYLDKAAQRAIRLQLPGSIQ